MIKDVPYVVLRSSLWVQYVRFWFSALCPQTPNFILSVQGECRPHLPSSPSALIWKCFSDSKVEHSQGSPHLFPDSHGLASSVLRTTVSYILWGILAILGGDVNPVLVTPSWLEAEILVMFICLVGTYWGRACWSVALQTLQIFLSQGLGVGPYLCRDCSVQLSFPLSAQRPSLTTLCKVNHSFFYFPFTLLLSFTTSFTRVKARISVRFAGASSGPGTLQVFNKYLLNN